LIPINALLRFAAFAALADARLEPDPHQLAARQQNAEAAAQIGGD
jgi:hypothetical protein